VRRKGRRRGNVDNAMSTDDEVFIYTGERGDSAPLDVVRVRVDPSVTSIHAKAFYERTKLTEVELCEGLVDIGERSFGWCNHSITKITIPNSLRRIRNGAFISSLRCPIYLRDGIESIGEGAFAYCIFTNFRVPPLITVIPNSMLSGCKSLFSLELPHTVMQIENYAFYHCNCLRNVAIPTNAVFGDDIFIDGVWAQSQIFSGCLVQTQALYGSCSIDLIDYQSTK
jgi:hypothetical protein